VAVRVRGSKCEPSDTHTVKLEDARITGYQDILMAILRDADYVKNTQIWFYDIIKKFTVKIADQIVLELTT
jgi:hypothetical protein